MNSGKNGVITRLGCDEFFEGGYEWFGDAVEAMMDKWERLSRIERASIKGRGYRNNRGDDYMVAVGSYDEETGEALDTMTLAEAIAKRDEEEGE